MKKQQSALFEKHEHALQKEYGECPTCGGELRIRNSKHGAFLGCSGYPTCDYSRPLVATETMDEQVIEGSSCPLCNNELAIKKGRYGIFIGCTNYPHCQHIEHEEEQNDIACPQCNKGHLAQRVSKYGKSFYACNDYPTCKYIINYQPLDQSCPSCDWGILIEKRGSSGRRVMCPQKSCGYKEDT